MSLPIYQVDAFAESVFKGNPAAVMPLEAWLDETLLQAIALENNLSETAYMVQVSDGYELRWFTPQVEVDLCGHATLAAAHVLFEHLHHVGDEIVFHTRSGDLRVSRSGRSITLDSRASLPRLSASTRTRSQARPTAVWCRTGRHACTSTGCSAGRYPLAVAISTANSGMAGYL